MNDTRKALELCWKPQPCERTSARTILLRLDGESSPSQPYSPVRDGDVESDSFDQSGESIEGL